MKVEVQNYQGKRDGLRWGLVKLDGVGLRHFNLDLLNLTLRLYVPPPPDRPDRRLEEDIDPEHISAVWAAF